MLHFCENNKKYELELINEYINSDAKQFINQVESNYKKYVDEIADKINNSERKVLMLSGPSSSGKTTTAKLIANALNKKFKINTELISLDDFYRGKGMAPLLPNGKFDYEDIEALDIKRIHDCLFSLMENGHCDKPVYDFNNCEPKPYTEHITIKKKDVVIVEGLHAINPIIYQTLPLDYTTKVYISISSSVYYNKQELFQPSDIRFLRRLVRGYYFRNTTTLTTLSMWEDVRRGERLHIEPFKKECDLLINSFHPYELSVIGKKAISLLESLDNDLKKYAKSIHEIKDKINKVEFTHEHYVPRDSLLREFIPLS